jgi:hypothetical protein
MTDTLKTILKREISFLENSIAVYEKKLNENFNYHFEWGVGGDLYQVNLEKSLLSNFLRFVTTEPNQVSNWLTYQISRIKKELARGGFLGGSTSTYSNLVHVYKKEVDCKLLEKYESYLELITRFDNPMEIL